MNSNNKNDAIQPPLVPTLRQICVSQARMLLRRDFFLLDTLSAELDARNNFRVVADFSNIAALSWSRKNIVAKMCVVEGPARFQASEDYIRTSEAMAGSIQYISSVSNGGAKSGASAQHCGPSFKSEAIHNMILFL